MRFENHSRPELDHAIKDIKAALHAAVDNEDPQAIHKYADQLEEAKLVKYQKFVRTTSSLHQGG